METFIALKSFLFQIDVICNKTGQQDLDHIYDETCQKEKLVICHVFFDSSMNPLHPCPAQAWIGWLSSSVALRVENPLEAVGARRASRHNDLPLLGANTTAKQCTGAEEEGGIPCRRAIELR